MADKGNTSEEIRALNKAKLILEIQQQKTNIFAGQYRLLQLEAEIRQIGINIESAKKMSAELETQLGILEKEN